MITLDWSKVYFGTVKRADVQKYIPDAEWQKVRLWMKGKTLVQKYETLSSWLEKCKYSHGSKVQCTNYVTALSRGGLIKPEEYRR